MTMGHGWLDAATSRGQTLRRSLVPIICRDPSSAHETPAERNAFKATLARNVHRNAC
jgi:hypothetical protein